MTDEQLEALSWWLLTATVAGSFVAGLWGGLDHWLAECLLWVKADIDVGGVAVAEALTAYRHADE